MFSPKHNNLYEINCCVFCQVENSKKRPSIYTAFILQRNFKHMSVYRIHKCVSPKHSSLFHINCCVFCEVENSKKRPSIYTVFILQRNFKHISVYRIHKCVSPKHINLFHIKCFGLTHLCILYTDICLKFL